MNVEETPLPVFEIKSKESLSIPNDKCTEKACYPDKNENKVEGERNEIFSGNEAISFERRNTQDSLNNNKICNQMCGQISCKKGCEDGNHTTPESFPTAAVSSKDSPTARRKRIKNKNSNRSSNCKPIGISSFDTENLQECQFTETIHKLSEFESTTVIEQSNQNLPPSKFYSIIPEEFKWTHNITMLPMSLHQIAESYFQEEDYEKAMQFIQLERIYHEQLLANLSVIQEEWETKWRMVECSKLPDNSEKSLSSLDLEKLSKLCGSHEEPKISKNRLTSAEKVLRIQGLTRLMQAEERHEVDREAGNPDGDTHAGRKPRKGRAPALTVMTEYTPSEARTVEDLSTAIDSKDLPNLGHVQEQQIYISSLTTEDHTQSIGTVGRSKSSTFSSGDSGKNNKLLQAEAIPVFNDVLELEESSREKEEHKGKTVIEKLISASSAHVDCGLVTQDDFSGMRNSSDCTKAVKSLQIKDRADAQYPDVGNEDIPLISTQIVDCTSREILEFSENTGCQNCLSDSDRDDQRQATVDFIAAFLSFQEETLSEEEITPSLGNTVLDELDELAKRIEVEEESPVAGLVSILKKHSESEKPGRSFKKQTKRKVHFQETEDSLEQEEIGGSSCILLILLCIATVFLSIGGTALYCTFGDVESSVCKDFAANMDFYYTQLLQGIEELKHWLYVA